MARRKKASKATGEPVVDLRHDGVTRLNIPPAGLAARGQIVKERQVRYAYNPHLAPGLRFDATGKADRIEQLIRKAGRQKLEPAEIRVLQEALRNHEPWLEWAGKREQQWCVADPVALHIHERVSTQAILRTARRQDVQRWLFADPEQDYRQAVQFYKHPMDWTNRVILGDSLAVMASLARREALAGKVQMIYMDPPYGIKFASNFQPEVRRRDVKDKDEDLTREPEMVKAYRDTWTLGVHSYLSYLRDRLLLCKELLADTGSIFVQISDENLHRVLVLMEEVFGPTNFVATIAFQKTSYATSDLLPTVNDYLIWFAKDRIQVKFHRAISDTLRSVDDTGAFCDDEVLISGAFLGRSETPAGSWFQSRDLASAGAGTGTVDYEFEGVSYHPGENRHWKTDPTGMKRLHSAGRLFRSTNSLRYKRFFGDSPSTELHNIWTDTIVGSFHEAKVYVVQTSPKVIQRCLLMTTDPGDLVLDPTCGSGTTACVAEEWGRRWITIDVSRVALAIARQRLLTAKFDYYRLRPTSAQDVQRNPDGPWLTDPEGQIQGTCTFDCKTVPHVTLKSIAQNPALDPIFAKWEPILAERLAALNKALVDTVSDAQRTKLEKKLAAKEKAEGKKSITDADRRRWLLPNPKSKVENPKWDHWQVPFDTDPDWPRPLQEALTDYRKAWRQKMDEVNACIAARADQEELVDRPEIDRSKVRVSGPFTVEGVIPTEESVDLGPEESPIGGAPDGLDTFGEAPIESDARNTEAYLDRMIRLIREDGVRFPGNKVMKFVTLEALADGSTLHAKGTWANGEGGERQVAVMFGPQYGPLIAQMVEDGIRIAARRGFDDLVFAAFSFDGAAQAVIQEDPDPKLRIHMAQIRPDVAMGDLLKTTVSSQLFTVSGSPRTRVERQKDGQCVVHMEGVDIYDPVSNSVYSTGAEKVAAWFLDSDYGGRCFCVCQAFFPDKDAWAKLGKALKGSLDDEAFSRLSGTVSLPFAPGGHKRIAIKVIDPRGNEVMRVHRLDGRYD
ncbi:MAG: site-specific DNA-methyltransferase [Phycisphaerae bacterium]|nr:site-specific DNA-methyltransferase [Phycisphaerae bacterium]